MIGPVKCDESEGQNDGSMIRKYEATRSEGDYQRKMLLARLCAIGGKDVVCEVKGIEEVGARGACMY
jgi:hypothetical protein